MSQKEAVSFNARIKEFLERIKKDEVSLLEERNFIEAVTDGYDLEKLQLLKMDVEFSISDERLYAMEINDEIKRNSNDEYFLEEKTYWRNRYKEAMDNLSDISKLRVRVIQQWIAEGRISSDELDLRKQFDDEVIDAVSAKQTSTNLVPCEGMFRPRLFRLKRLNNNIDYWIRQEKDETAKELTKPHKDEIYKMYGSFKKTMKVEDAFYALCDKIEEMGLNTADYFTTDTPENFNKAYTNWKTAQNKKPTSHN